MRHCTTKDESVMFVNFRMFICLFNRQGSIPNNNNFVWNASLSLKQSNKHSKISKQDTFIFTYPTLKENRKIARFFLEKKRRCGGCLSPLHKVLRFKKNMHNDNTNFKIYENLF